jgi:signal transduction protein with GAF and PtsI domain
MDESLGFRTLEHRSGQAIYPGRASGRAHVLAPTRWDVGAAPPLRPADALERALAPVLTGIEVFVRRALALGIEAGFLSDYQTIATDARLRERVLALTDEGAELGAALRAVASEATVAAARAGDSFRMYRARQITEICEAIATFARPSTAAPRGSVLVSASARAGDLVAAVQARPVALIVSQRVLKPTRLVWLRLLAVPIVADVAQIAVRDGDVVGLDAAARRVWITAQGAEPMRRMTTAMR